MTMSALSDQLPDSEFEELIQRHRSQLFGYALSLLGNRSDAEDVVQQTTVILWEKRDQYTPGTYFLAWARTITRFQAANHRRKEAIRRHEPLVDDQLEAAIHERVEEREREFSRLRKGLQICLQALPERQKQAVEGRYFQGKSVQALAEEMGLKPNAVSQILFRARASLIDCVQTQTQSRGLSEPSL